MSHDGASDAPPDADPLADVDPHRHPVILFDGVCNLCHGTIRFLVRHDDEGVFRFAPLDSPVGQALLREHGLPTEDHNSFVLVEGDETSQKSTAALRVARRLGAPWRFAWALRRLPLGIRDAAYDVVAEYRYEVFGKKDACEVPEPEVRERFAERALE
ncbi:thiol-disulfide oxidoreductase DCC family protein [Halobaculum halobium]|uniref:Thiol-disulfide oxidoreductase DCC family protein n=1 Tax=Halobaculum halobium TaxID=3032281 RepID=A0ABD5TAX0_9EURY|nr:thiol-disulfide oxidoreductase DCC family protein [Halobaculum sp. SYNS20]